MKLGFGASFEGEIDRVPEEIYKQVWNDDKFWETFRIRDLQFVKILEGFQLQGATRVVHTFHITGFFTFYLSIMKAGLSIHT